MKKILFIVILTLLTLSFSSAAFADEAYDITDYDVHIVVSEDNVLDVVERLTLDYSQYRHGFYYNRQYTGKKENVVDGEVMKMPFWYNIKDIKVIGHKYEKSRYSYNNDKYIQLKIGDPNSTVIGEQEYVLTYKSELSDDGFSEFDEFYQDLLYCDYGDTIERASFIIEFPKNIDKDNVYVYLGEYNGNSDVYFEVGSDTIKGYTLRPMQGGEVLTVRVEMEEGYFTSTRKPYTVWQYIIFGVSGACVLLALMLWIAFGRDKKVYPTVEFYPPDGMTSAEAGYVIDGTVDNKDIISLIIYWADKGYIKIKEKSKNDIDLVKVKELPESAKRYEKNLFSALFESGDIVDTSTYKNKFYIEMQAAKSGITNYFESAKTRRVFTSQSKLARGFMGIITMLPVALTLFMFMYFSIIDYFWTMFVVVFASVFISLPVFMLVRLFEHWRSTKKSKKIAKMIFSFTLLGTVFLIYLIGVPGMFDSVRAEFSILVTRITTLATVILMILTAIMKKRTDVGSAWYGKLLGFKEFIEKAEKDRIMRLVEENPSYFYSVLPYAYVLGVTDKWAKKFEGINMQNPSWYNGYSGNIFTTTMFVHSMSKSMTHIQHVATSRPSSSGSGGSYSGGGGFSGGGGGGGGAGGSW